MNNKQNVRGATNFIEQMENAEQLMRGKVINMSVNVGVGLTNDEKRFMDWFTTAESEHQLSAIEFFMDTLKVAPKDNADHQQALKLVPILVKHVLFNTEVK